MKTNLLKTMVLALALLPMGAWAQSSPDFGTEEVVSEETTWVFNDYATGDKTEFSQTDKLLLRVIIEEESIIGVVRVMLQIQQV